MAINTGGYAVTGSIPTLIGPTTKPVVFNYANGQTMAPTSGGDAYARGMEGMGQSLGSAIQQAAQNLNANTIAKNQAARAQANMQTQLTPMQQALMQAQMGRDTGQANMMGNVYGQANDKMSQQRAEQQASQGTPMPGTQSSAISPPMPPIQGTGLIGLNPSNGVASMTRSPNSIDLPMGPAVIDYSSPTGLKNDPRYENYLATQQAANNPIADKVASDYLNNDAVKSYPMIATNYKIINDLQARSDKGETLSTADTGNLANAYANVTNPEGRAQGMSVQDIIAKSDLSSQLKTEFAKFYGGESTAIAPKIQKDLTKAATNNFQARQNNAYAAHDLAMQTVKGSYLDTQNQLSNKLPDVVSIYNKQLGIGQKQSNSTSNPSGNRDQLKNTVASIIQKHPEWNPSQVKQAAASGQY